MTDQDVASEEKADEIKTEIQSEKFESSKSSQNELLSDSHADAENRENLPKRGRPKKRSIDIDPKEEPKRHAISISVFSTSLSWNFFTVLLH